MRHLIIAFGFVSLATGCMSSGSTPPGDDDENIDCSTITGTDEFVVGLNKVGQSSVLDFTIVSGTPAPPIRGDNTWVIQVNAHGAAAPVSGAAMTVTPFMPAHQHGAGKSVVVTPQSSAGDYQLSPVNLWMPGVWETTLDVQSGSGDDRVVFKFCIPS